jgi:hypothetical protein
MHRLTLTTLENLRIRKEILNFFNFDKYLSLRFTISPLLRSFDRSGIVSDVPLRDTTALRVDAGGFLDCMGQLRGDISTLCPSCGRMTCDRVEIEEFV